MKAAFLIPCLLAGASLASLVVVKGWYWVELRALWLFIDLCPGH